MSDEINPQQKTEIDAWAKNEAAKGETPDASALRSLNSYARDRLAYEIGLYNQITDGHFGFGIVMSHAVGELGADPENVAGFLRAEDQHGGEKKAEEFLTAYYDAPEFEGDDEE